jgi:hypothetical protein
MVRNKIIKYYFVNPNADITSLYTTRMLCSASAPEPALSFLEQIVRPCDALFSGCGVPINNRIYPVTPDPHQKPDAHVASFHVFYEIF